VPEVQYLVLGSADFAMSNIAFEPIHGNFVINEDGDGPEAGNNDIWSCLDDGDDPRSVGWLRRVISLNDLTRIDGASSTRGRPLLVSIQHNVTGHGVVLDITGCVFFSLGHEDRLLTRTARRKEPLGLLPHSVIATAIRS